MWMEDEILEKAKERLNHEREVTDDTQLREIAELWTTYLHYGVRLSEMDVALMMVLLKVARANHRVDGKLTDDFVDICGYGALASRGVKEKVNAE